MIYKLESWNCKWFVFGIGSYICQMPAADGIIYDLMGYIEYVKRHNRTVKVHKTGSL